MEVKIITGTAEEIAKVLPAIESSKKHKKQGVGLCSVKQEAEILQKHAQQRLSKYLE